MNFRGRFTDLAVNLGAYGIYRPEPLGVVDLMGNATADGVYNDGAQMSGPHSPDSLATIGGANGLALDGVNDYVDLAIAGLGALLVNGYSMFCSFSAFTSAGAHRSFGPSRQQNSGFSFRQSSGGVWHVIGHNEANATFLAAKVTMSPNLNDGKFHTAGISWKESANTLLFYFDGVEQTTTYSTQVAHGAFGAGGIWQIGAHGGGSWDGVAFIGHNSTFNRDLTAAEQLDLYRAATGVRSQWRTMPYGRPAVKHNPGGEPV